MALKDVLTMDSLVGSLLGLRLSDIRSLAPDPPTEDDDQEGTTCRGGLNLLMRRILTHYLGLMPLEHANLRLHTEHSAVLAGWPNARTANFAVLLTWGLFGEDRRLAGFGPVPLLAARDGFETQGAGEPDLPLRPARDLVNAYGRAPVVALHKRGGDDALWAQSPSYQGAVLSTNALIRDNLGLDPLVLAFAFKRFAGISDRAFDPASEEAGRAGLNLLLRDVIRQYHRMYERGTEEVRLMGEHDARDGCRPDAKSANFATMLSAALVGEDWQVRWFPERPYSPAREELLRALATEVAESGSRAAKDGFELIHDDMIHHDAWARGTKKRRLLDEAYRANWARSSAAEAFGAALPKSKLH